MFTPDDRARLLAELVATAEADQLPAEITLALAQGRARDTGTPELIGAFGAGCAMLLAELDQHDHGQPEFSADIRLEREGLCT